VYSGARKVPPAIEEISSIASEFRTRQFDDKFLSIDVLTVKDRKDGETIPATKMSNTTSQSTNPHSSSASRAPPPPPPRAPSHPQGVVLYEYVAETGGGMLSVRQGMTLSVTDRSNDDWWLVVTDSGESGWVPASYIQMK
jgi:hypothetical protein